MCGDTILLVASLALGSIRTQWLDTIIKEIWDELSLLDTFHFLLCQRLGLGLAICDETLGSLAISDIHHIFAS